MDIRSVVTAWRQWLQRHAIAEHSPIEAHSALRARSDGKRTALTVLRWLGVGGTVVALFEGVAERRASADVREWDVPREGAINAAARSFVITDRQNAPVLREPMSTAAIEGHVALGTGFAVRSLARAGSGCRAQWIEIDDHAWVCGDRGVLSINEPHAQSMLPQGAQSLPWGYAFTDSDGVHAYHTDVAASALSADPATFDVWEAHWGFAMDSLVDVNGTRVIRTRDGHYLRRGDIYRASPSEFEGASYGELSAGAPGVPFGWVTLGATRIFAQPQESGRGEPLARLSRVHVYGVQGSSRRAMARVGENQWVRADHLRWIAPEPPPPQVNTAQREHWIDVDLSSQILIAYEGTVPMYSTLISSGIDRMPTLPGVFRIWGKYLAHTMDNTENARIASHFRLGDVPYVQFFDGDRGLHGVYWHDQFGVPRSHGCINMSPRDARWVFQFTAHPLPPGWLSRAMAPNQGTIVRIRGRATPSSHG
jgi:lipoprotein-anchoring transpeptidase ErfK/SrfK